MFSKVKKLSQNNTATMQSKRTHSEVTESTPMTSNASKKQKTGSGPKKLYMMHEFDSFECKLNDGKVAWEQPTFKYQSKCLDWICAQYNALDVASKTALNGTGCMELFQYGNGANVSKL